MKVSVLSETLAFDVRFVCLTNVFGFLLKLPHVPELASCFGDDSDSSVSQTLASESW